MFTYTPFTIDPSYCEPTITCDSVNPSNANVPCEPIGNNPQTATWNFDGNDYPLVEPGTYVVTYQVCVLTTCEPFTVDINLTDACDAPNSITVPSLENQIYTITDNQIDYTHPDFVATPAFCPVEYTYNVPTLDNGGVLIS